MSITEHEQQRIIFEWAEWQKGKYPELEMLIAVPNGGKRDIVTAVKLKQTGTKAGFPDMFLFCRRGAYAGLAIELKVKSNKPTERQKWWIKKLREQDYCAVVCYGADEAISVIQDYLRGKKWNPQELLDWVSSRHATKTE